MNYIEIEELLKVGAHFGHPTRKWNPKFSPYIATKKNGVHIIDLNETNRCLNIAVQELTKIVKSNGNVLFVGTKNKQKMLFNRQLIDVVCIISSNVGWEVL